MAAVGNVRRTEGATAQNSRRATPTELMTNSWVLPIIQAQIKRILKNPAGKLEVRNVISTKQFLRVWFSKREAEGTEVGFNGRSLLKARGEEGRSLAALIGLLRKIGLDISGQVSRTGSTIPEVPVVPETGERPRAMTRDELAEHPELVRAAVLGDLVGVLKNPERGFKVENIRPRKFRDYPYVGKIGEEWVFFRGGWLLPRGQQNLAAVVAMLRGHEIDVEGEVVVKERTWRYPTPQEYGNTPLMKRVLEAQRDRYLHDPKNGLEAKNIAVTAFLDEVDFTYTVGSEEVRFKGRTLARARGKNENRPGIAALLRELGFEVEGEGYHRAPADDLKDKELLRRLFLEHADQILKEPVRGFQKGNIGWNFIVINFLYEREGQLRGFSGDKLLKKMGKVVCIPSTEELLEELGLIRDEEALGQTPLKRLRSLFGLGFTRLEDVWLLAQHFTRCAFFWMIKSRIRLIVELAVKGLVAFPSKVLNLQSYIGVDYLGWQDSGPLLAAHGLTRPEVKDVDANPLMVEVARQIAGRPADDIMEREVLAIPAEEYAEYDCISVDCFRQLSWRQRNTLIRNIAAGAREGTILAIGENGCRFTSECVVKLGQYGFNVLVVTQESPLRPEDEAAILERLNPEDLRKVRDINRQMGILIAKRSDRSTVENPDFRFRLEKVREGIDRSGDPAELDGDRASEVDFSGIDRGFEPDWLGQMLPLRPEVQKLYEIRERLVLRTEGTLDRSDSSIRVIYHSFRRYSRELQSLRRRMKALPVSERRLVNQQGTAILRETLDWYAGIRGRLSERLEKVAQDDGLKEPLSRAERRALRQQGLRPSEIREINREQVSNLYDPVVDGLRSMLWGRFA
ncbi:hypothetical protein ACFL5U_04045 [Candidatus Margulisiibacteriota bacterium]